MASTKTWAAPFFLLLLLCSVCLEFAVANANVEEQKVEHPQGKVPKTVRCRNKKFPTCYWIPLSCPTGCRRSCKVDCEICKPVCHCNKPGAICNDPQFVGGDGITFYFHGKKDKDFCLVTDTNLHINGHFIGRRGDGMKRDFTWVQSIGVLFGTHKLFLGAKKVAQWNDAVDQLAIAFDGEPVSLPTTENAEWTAADSSLTITRSGSTTNEVVLEAQNNFKIAAKVVPITKQDSMVHRYGISDDDCFAHLDLGFRFYALTGSVNGVLGQTYADNYESRAKIGLKMPVLGGDREFASSGLFTTDCAVARFKGIVPSSVEGAVVSDDGDLKCKTGFNGRGMICKK
ncbi:hypothetical protein EJ110_NYTH48175 [Nymphaea thermarum]|nr:hypothetical protein EJ110_NYTH48175 [Nymphaea thermarum]